ncbi:PepSY domain-containing protein [Calditrichota bacterium GD2]
MKFKNLIYIKSRWIHKVFGLILIPFLIWMSISGIILNHPEVFARFNVPSWLVPSHYHIKNWNRSSIIGAVHVNDTEMFIYGKKGVWQVDDARKVHYVGQGFPQADYYKKTNHMIFLTHGNDSLLIAATDGGLFLTSLNRINWQKIELPGKPEKLKKILKIDDALLVFGESNVFRADLTKSALQFSIATPLREETEKSVTMVQLFFDIHDGKAWGLAGKLLMDFIGLVIIFASVTGFYVWFSPWRNRKRANSTFKARTIARLRSWNKWHIKIGALVVVFFILLGSTGLFMRPPFLAAIAEKDVPAAYYPGKLSQNPWERKIQNALYDPFRDRLIIATSEGLWAGPGDLRQEFEKIDLNVPIFVMGPTYFECLPNGHYRIASFNGIFDYNPQTDQAVDLITGQIPNNVSTVRPADIMVTGYFQLNDGSEWITAHEQGICNLEGKVVNIWRVPESMIDINSLSLWNFMFELHNGRIFKSVVGSLYILIIPLGSILFLLISFSGLYDWAFRKFRKKGTLLVARPNNLLSKNFNRQKKMVEV